jgi:hypothetical protein
LGGSYQSNSVHTREVNSNFIRKNKSVDGKYCCNKDLAVSC